MTIFSQTLKSPSSSKSFVGSPELTSLKKKGNRMLLIIFRYDFIVYQAINHPPQHVTGNNFKRKVNYFANFYLLFDGKRDARSDKEFKIGNRSFNFLMFFFKVFYKNLILRYLLLTKLGNILVFFIYLKNI